MSVLKRDPEVNVMENFQWSEHLKDKLGSNRKKTGQLWLKTKLNWFVFS